MNPATGITVLVPKIKIMFTCQIFLHSTCKTGQLFANQLVACSKMSQFYFTFPLQRQVPEQTLEL